MAVAVGGARARRSALGVGVNTATTRTVSGACERVLSARGGADDGGDGHDVVRCTSSGHSLRASRPKTTSVAPLRANWVVVEDRTGERVGVVNFLSIGAEIRGGVLCVGDLGRARIESRPLALAVGNGASRSIYIQDVEAFSEEKLRADFGAFGGLERVRILKSKERQVHVSLRLEIDTGNCAHVNFTHIWSAIRAVTVIAKQPEYALLRITYSQDRCARPPRPAPQPSQRSASENGEVGSGESIGSVAEPLDSNPPGTDPKAGGTKATHSKNPPTAIQALQELWRLKVAGGEN
ncbi:hypothetical protein C8F04DRAFT_1190933 [Mycena alexandri]|uniref:Uncharacterized protein n=1 Tax=Mycena alexandri TaxID=1745969 RepID=A0AAD6WWJ4_9AGAR|nr:hypothetical protein C8F04DRAFT_1190933 [Mycena alexandri]